MQLHRVRWIVEASKKKRVRLRNRTRHKCCWYLLNLCERCALETSCEPSLFVHSYSEFGLTPFDSCYEFWKVVRICSVRTTLQECKDRGQGHFDSVDFWFHDQVCHKLRWMMLQNLLIIEYLLKFLSVTFSDSQASEPQPPKWLSPVTGTSWSINGFADVEKRWNKKKTNGLVENSSTLMGAIRVVHSFSMWIHLTICCKGRVSTTQSSRFRIWLTKFYWGSSAWGARRATAWGTARTIRAPTRTRSLGEQCWSYGTSLVEVSYVSCLMALVHGCPWWSHSGSDTKLRPAVTFVAKRICRNFVRKGALATFQWTDVSSHFCFGQDIQEKG